MARPKSFRNPTRVSLTLNRDTIVTARKLARSRRRSLSETVSEILDRYFKKNGRSFKPGRSAETGGDGGGD